MKINKKLSAAITLSLMLGVYGSASAADHYLSGIDGTDGTFSVTDFAGNTVTVTTKAGGVDVRSWANYGSNSNATAHELTVAQGTWEYVSGGHRFGGEVNGNKVTIGTDVASGPLVQRIVIGGKTGGYSNKKAIGDAINNEVILVSGQVGGVTGGSADYGGNVINNKVQIVGGIVKRTDNRLGYIYGGWAGNSSISIAKGNEVHILRAQDGVVFARVSGGYADAGAIDNSVEITNGVKVTDTVTGGYAYEGTLTGNHVTITDDANVEKEVYGARSYKGTAIKNVVELEAAIIGVYNSDTGADVYGAYSYYSTKDNKFGVANENVVNITNSQAGNIYGGYAGIGAESNEVNIIGNSAISGTIYGGYAVNGNVTENKVTIEGGTVNALVGGSTDNGNAVKNVVTINDGAVKDTIIRGGWAMGSGAETGIADSNKVIITGAEISSLGVSKIQGMVIGGTGATKASNNLVEVSGVKTANLSVIGGDSYNGETSGNTVIVSGATTSIGTVTGGSSSEGNVYSNTVQVIEGAEVASANGGFATMGAVGAAGKGNKVVVDGGLVPVVVYGGQTAVSGDVSYNKVEIVSGTVGNDNPKFGMVYGGYTKKGTASSNEVTITGGEITGDVYGGVSEDGAANDNIVNLGGYDDGTTVAVNKASVKLPGKVIGGQGKSTKGNTLNVFSKDNVIGALEGFQVEKFYMPGDTKPGDTFVKVANSVNMDGISFKADFPEGNPLTYGDKVKLINAPAVSNMSDVREARAKKTAFTDWVFKVYQGDDAMNQVASGANNVVAELVDDAAGEDSKSLVETMAAATTILADGSDLLASVGFANAAAAVNAAGGDSEKGSPNAVLTIFGAANGNKSRVKSGSYVDVKGWNFNLGAAKEVNNRFGKLLFAPVIEYGIGSYDSYLNDGYHGEGETKFVGGGLMAKQTNNNGFYLEGSVRAGKMSVDYQSNDGKYDSDSPYLAAHFGLGKVLKVNDKNNVDIYGKYFYSHQSGDDVTLHGTDKNFDLSFDSVNSHRTRLGARFNHIVRDTKSLYAGLAWQHEFRSTARATIDGMTTPAPSMKGDTGIIELGVKVNEGEHLGLDLGVTGSIGKKKGAGLNLNFNWKF